MSIPAPDAHRVIPIHLAQVPAPADAGLDPAEVLARTVADTALGVTGVHRLGTPLGRLVESARRSVTGSPSYPGVTIGHDGSHTTISVSLVVEYPANVTAVADHAREQISHAVQQLHENSVSVDVTVTDVHGPFDETDATAADS
ncbi:Asp23/Gls24 family envelope stress response protein [Herbiconiux sp. P18]|uniref:Asp23/Gls24 family envelope stress response protein n=1 Tax=Herbiconiux liangxiaofengii TaxID=3342795 RepID=UPI0035B9B0A6